jgi:endonuclease/exonuclease/phosphatase family metal-dependent hydrolase
VALRVLTWNVMHGRSVPGAGRDLLGEFTAALAGWEWDVALLQEVPPWWPRELASALGASAHTVLTSRNSGLPARQAVAIRWPDLIKSNGGGANVILVHDMLGPVAEHRTLRLARWPERRWLHAVRLPDPHGWVGNLHLSIGDDARATREAARAAAALRAWSLDRAAILGGDFNVRALQLDGFTQIGNSDVDYVFAAAGQRAGGPATNPRRGDLSDHAPLLTAVDQTM